MKKHFIIYTTSDLNIPNAPNSRYLSIARGLVEKGVEVSIVLPHGVHPDLINTCKEYQRIEFVNLYPKKISSYPKKSIARRVHQYLSIYSLHKYVAFIASDKLTYMYFDGRNFFISLLNRLICEKYNIKKIYFRAEYPLLGHQNNITKNFYEKIWNKVIIRNMDHIFVISTALKRYYYDVIKCNKNGASVHILNMMVESEKYYKNVSSTERNNIVYVGTPYGTKDGVYDLIHAFSFVMNIHKDTDLIIIGDNTRKELMKEVLSSISNLADPNRVKMVGQQSREIVIDFINSAYCLVLARPNNIQAKYGFPTKLGEYLATSRPVVLTDVGDISLFLKDGENAYIAYPDNIQSFAEKLNECLSDPVKANTVGQNGKLLAESVFSYKNAVTPLYEVL